jgi:2,4-diaminopentanoate dehydrogenase
MAQSTYQLNEVPMRRYRVIQWFTGQIASEQVRLMARNPRYEIVGAVCHHAEKHGRDLGEVVGIEPLGVKVTSDPVEALAVDADVVLYNPLALDIAQVEAMLTSGKNVISLMGPWDASTRPELEALDRAARSAEVTLVGAGNIPGLVNDVVPTLLTGFVSDVRHIWSRERSFLAEYKSKDVLGEVLGIGKPLDQHGPNSPTGKFMVDVYVDAFNQAHHSMARALGVLSAESRWTTKLASYEAAPSPETFTLASSGLEVRRGTVAGFRYEISSILDGERWATTEVEHTVCLGLQDGWRASHDEHDWTVRVTGRPSVELSFGIGDSLDHTKGMVDLNAARLVNLIPAVVEAAPGAKPFFELPIVTSVARASG